MAHFRKTRTSIQPTVYMFYFPTQELDKTQEISSSSIYLPSFYKFRRTVELTPIMVVLLSSQSAALLAASSRNHRTANAKFRSSSGRKYGRPLTVVAMAQESSDGGGEGITEKIAIAGGLISNPVIGWSLYTLKTTGCGLPPGPGGSIGAIEGVSYLVVAGIVAWSLYTKSKTGSGLPNGPYGLLGAVEGLCYLTLLAILVVFGLQFLQQGSIPGPLPSAQCFG